MGENGEKKRERMARMVPGLIITGVGVVCLGVPMIGAGKAVGSSGFEWLIFLGPVLTVGGLVAAMRGLFCEGRLFSGAALLITGAVLIVIAALPWVYGAVFPPSGAGESLGMLGTILFLVAGLPGILLLPIGFVIWLIGR